MVSHDHILAFPCPLLWPLAARRLSFGGPRVAVGRCVRIRAATALGACSAPVARLEDEGATLERHATE